MIDLHVHSNCSDGKLSVVELSDIIKKSNLKFFSLADHDTVDGVEEMKKLLELQNVKLIAATELSALYHEREIHILAYDFNVAKAKNILDERKNIINDLREKELTEVVAKFRESGFIISDHIKPVPQKTIGFIVALDAYTNEKNKDKMIKDAGHLPTEKEFYDLYQRHDAPCYVKKSGVTLEWVIDKFKGLAQDIILAHPFVPVSFTIEPLNKEEINELIKIEGITGLEVYHHKTSPEQIDYLLHLVKDNDLSYTGGSDFHSEKGGQIGCYEPGRAIPSFKLKNYQYNNV